MILEFLASALDWFEVAVWFLAKAKGFGVVIVLVALTLIAVVVGAVVAGVRRALQRHADRRVARNNSPINEGDL